MIRTLEMTKASYDAHLMQKKFAGSIKCDTKWKEEFGSFLFFSFLFLVKNLGVFFVFTN